MLISEELGAAVWKLSQLVEAIKSDGRRQGYGVKSANEEIGIYFKRGKQDVLWFGVWPEFWKDKGFPLCFGVDQSWGAGVLASFRNAYKDSTDYKSNKTIWTIGWFNEEILNSEDAARRIWEQLDAILRAMPTTEGAAS